MQILGISNFYPTAPTTAPTSLSAVPTNVDVAISFTAPTNDGGMPITNYEYSFNNSTWTALSPSDAASPVTVGGLTQNTAYTVYLRAVNGIGSGPGSTGVSFTTAGVPTGTPTITSVPTGTTTATVNYTYPGGGGAVTGWDLYVANQTNAWNNTTASPISVTGLSPNTTYTFYVRAKNAYGVGPQSAGVNGTTLKVAPTSIELMWVAGGGVGGSHVSGAGGGGAGGLLATTMAVSAGTTYTATVGGAGSGSGFTGQTTAVAGGAGGSSRNATGGTGGSGGGGAGEAGAGGAGTAGHGSNGGAAQYRSGGGGGGKTGTGGSGTANGTGGAGGAGTNAYSAWGAATGVGQNISGTLWFAGGGGGAAQFAGTGAAGAGNGAAHTGGGGTGLNGAGFSGVVILRYSDSFANPASTTGTQFTTGGYVYIRFTGTGTVVF